MLAFSLKNVMYTHTWYIYNTCLFLKKLYKYTYICIRDGTRLGRPCPVSRPVPKRNFVPSRFVPSPNFLGQKFPVPKCLGTGRENLNTPTRNDEIEKKIMHHRSC